MLEQPGVVIVAFRSRRDLPGCLEALRRTAGGPPPLVLIENGCPEGSADCVAGIYPEAEVVRLAENRGSTGGYNEGIRRFFARGQREIILLNPDARPEPDWLLELTAAAAALPDAGIIGALLLDGDGGALDPWQARLLDNLGTPREGWPAAATGEPIDVPSVIAAAVWLRSDALRRAGGFDPLYFTYGEETDLCRRVQHRGLRVVLVPRSRVRHLGHGSSRTWSQDLRRRWLMVRARALLVLKRPHLGLRTGVIDLVHWGPREAWRALRGGHAGEAVMCLAAAPLWLLRLRAVARSREAEVQEFAHLESLRKGPRVG